MALTVVRANGSDAETVAMLVAALLDELSSGRGPALEELRATAKRLLEEEDVFGLLALSDGRPCGVFDAERMRGDLRGRTFRRDPRNSMSRPISAP